MIDIWTAVFGGLIGFWIGVISENRRKRKWLKMDADRGVTFIDGEPYILKDYTTYDAEVEEAENEKGAEAP